MRTTLTTIYSMIQTNIDRITTDMTTINGQIASGLKMSKPSDDPVNLISALRFRSSIKELEQYDENLTLGSTTISGSEEAFRKMKDLVVRGKELAIQAINPVLSQSEHLSIAEEVKNLHEQAVMLANSQVNGKYIFGGYRTTGYSDAEPTPFIIDKGDGHWLNGQTPTTANAIAADTLRINGVAIAASVNDGISTVDADASAAAKATAINDVTTGAQGTGVSAEVIPATVQGAASVTAGTINAGEFLINGVDIGPLTAQNSDQNNTLITAINSATSSTGVKASRNSSGELLLTAVDGRNVQVQDASGLTGLTPGVSYGSIQLRSNRIFTMESSLVSGPPVVEPGFVSLGISGGSAVTGESSDVADDGKIIVSTIRDQTGTVRYAGDRENDLEIKIGKVESMVIGENGQTGVADTGVFTALKQLEDALRGNNYTAVTSQQKATDRTVTLDSDSTGLEGDTFTPFSSGTFSVTVTDHDTDPPTSQTVTLDIDPTVDTLDAVTQRIDGIAHISASWNADDELVITSDQPERYTFTLDDDNSNFLQNVGIAGDDQQYNALNQSLTNLDTAMNEITEKVSSFGAKANRIDVQAQIYSGLMVAAKENLSDVQDTDIVKAIMDLKAKETAYQATLSSAAKTMQLSLVDYL